MNNSPSVEYFRNKGLLPFQAEFAVTFLAEKSKLYWQLVSPVGTGKTRLAGAIIAHESEVSDKKRFLLLCPASLLTQWQYVISEMLSSAKRGIKPLIIDRKTYLEIESSVPVGQNPWPPIAIILMSIDLAKRDDMVKNLATVNWDLVILDESHLLKGKRRALFDHLVKSGVMKRVLLLTATPLHKVENIVKKIIKYQDILDWEGKPLFPSFEKKLIIIDFERTNEEKAFLNEVQKLTKELATLRRYGKFQSLILLRVASSSIYALEESLRRLLVRWKIMRNKITHNIPWTNEDVAMTEQDLIAELDEVEIFEEVSNTVTIQPKKFIELYQKLEALIDRIEEMRTDSKLNSLLHYLKTSFEGKRKKYLCIWTSFRNTAEYLMSSVQDLQIPSYLLTGSLTGDEKNSGLDLFRKKGGILISTDALMEGMTLEFVDECINYDLPLNPNKFEQRWGRFLRYGRKTEFHMVILRDQLGAFMWEEKLLWKLQRTIAPK